MTLDGLMCETVTITGIRDLGVEDEVLISQAMQSLCGGSFLRRIRFGGARGTDTLALLAAIEFATGHVELEIVVPSRIVDQPVEARSAINKAMSRRSFVRVVELRHPAYNHQRYQLRNVTMILGSPEHHLLRADVVLGFWHGRPGGTKNCLEAAPLAMVPTVVVPLKGGE